MVVEPETAGAEVAQRLMRTCLAVPPKPIANNPLGFGKGLKPMLPSTPFFQASKEPLDDAVLFRRVWGNEFLPQPVVTTGPAKPSALEDDPIVTAQPRGQFSAGRRFPNRWRHAASTSRSASLAQPRSANS